jgi:nitronate monooxygenase
VRRGPFHTPLCDLLGIRHPILLAGMAGGYTTPELVAGVSRAGGLGTFGATGMTAAALAEAVERARALTDAPIAVNVLLAPPAPPDPPDAAQRVQDHLGGFREELGIPHPPPRPPGAGPSAPAELVAAALEAGAGVVSVGLGDPAPLVPLARAAGAPVLAMVTTVAEARRAVASGADAIVAQGGEAGGHRSTFELPADGSLPMVGTVALVPQVARAVPVPVVAAGGLMDGGGLVAALALGACGVQLGTRFLLAADSGATASYRGRLRAAGDTDTVVTTALSGRPARAIRSRLLDGLERGGPGPLGWPRQAAATADVRAAADRLGRPELAAYLAGQAAGLGSDEELHAEQVVERIVAEALATVERLSAALGAG